MANTLSDLRNRIDAIESCYEFMLAYAAQGLETDAGSPAGGQLREFLGNAEDAMTGLADTFRAYAEEAGEQLGSRDAFLDFVQVLDRDVQASLAAVRLVRSQPGISSQLIDNLNALIHLRAVLTDLFVLDEILPAVESNVVN